MGSAKASSWTSSIVCVGGGGEELGVIKTMRLHKPQLVDSTVLQLWVATTEVGKRLNKKALELLRAAAAGRAQHEPAPLRRQAARAWEARWTTLLAVAAQNALCATLVQEGSKILDAPCSAEPLGVDVWLDGVHAWGPRSAAEERPQDAPAAE